MRRTCPDSELMLAWNVVTDIIEITEFLWPRQWSLFFLKAFLRGYINITLAFLRIPQHPPHFKIAWLIASPCTFPLNSWVLFSPFRGIEHG